jgi:hypothetical protein
MEIQRVYRQVRGAGGARRGHGQQDLELESSSGSTRGQLAGSTSEGQLNEKIWTAIRRHPACAGLPEESKIASSRT